MKETKDLTEIYLPVLTILNENVLWIAPFQYVKNFKLLSISTTYVNSEGIIQPESIQEILLTDEFKCKTAFD